MKLKNGKTKNQRTRKTNEAAIAYCAQKKKTKGILYHIFLVVCGIVVDVRIFSYKSVLL